ncbi:T9SS type A sorting domain-containing protein, partial [bacterium]|nr:T9SS type A sorting domain-containing protein [bacterium]
PFSLDNKVNDDNGTSDQRYPKVATDNSGNFVICWEDGRNGSSDIYFQRYDSSGNTQNKNIKVSNDINFPQYFSELDMNNNGDFLIGWRANANIYCQRYDSSSNTQGDNIKINEDNTIIPPGYQSITMNNNGKIFITWEDIRSNHYLIKDIYCQVIDSSGNTSGTNFQVNDDSVTYYQENPAIIMNNNGNVIISWEDSRNFGWYSYIYCQRYDSSGNAIGINIKVNDASGNHNENPSLAMNGNENFVISWRDNRNGDYDIYSQRYDSNGNTQGNNIKVNDDTGAADQEYPSIAMDNIGDYVITWCDNRSNFTYDIYCQRYDSSGDTIGLNFRVNENSGTSDQIIPVVAISNNGNFVICWIDSGNANIYCQRYDSSGNTQGSNIKVNDVGGVSDQGYSSIAIDDNGDFVITWSDFRNGNTDIYFQRYDSSGSAVGTNFRVNDDLGSSDQENPSVAMSPDGSKFIISWTDYSNPDGDSEIMAQLYEKEKKVGGNVQVNDADLFAYNHQKTSKYSVSCNNNQIGFTWMDNRRHKGWDIYAKLTDWQEFAPNVSNFSNNLNGIKLYPNPFKQDMGTDVITFANLTENAKIQIYTITGNLVFEVEAESIDYPWNLKNNIGDDIKSGIYIYLITNDNGEKKIGKFAVIK